MRSELNYRTFVVANPTAAAGEVREEWDLLERLMRARLPELDAAFTEGQGHATLLTREALRAGWEMIVCVGGDGTLNEVVNGFFEEPSPEEAYRLENSWVRQKQKPRETELINPDAVLGVVPMGTGGDFRRSVGLMGGVREAIEHLSGREVRPVDVGEVGFLDFDDNLDLRYFMNIASTGFSGAVDAIANDMWKGLGGKTSFLLASARAFLTWRNVDIKAIMDETMELSGKMFNLIAANGEFFGGGMWIAPGAELDDGKFQVVEMGDMSHSEMIYLLPYIFRGRHLGLESVHRYQAKTLRARTLDPTLEVPLDVDGETPGKLPAHWCLHHRALKMKF